MVLVRGSDFRSQKIKIDFSMLQRILELFKAEKDAFC
jgi:hypothetical protein